VARVHHVKKARKDYKEHGIKKGQEYWWVGMKTGPRSSIKKYFTKPPRASQLTQSSFYQALYSLQEDMADAQPVSVEDVEALVGEWTSSIDEIRDTCQESFDNMPEGLQQGDTGQLLQERIDAMESWSSDLQSVDCTKADDEEESEAVERLMEEIGGFDPGV
jgi:hypothetical protein